MTTVLIVDDSMMMRNNLRRAIEQGEYKVIGEASNGLEAYNLYKKNRPDLVTMDITMPKVDGIEGLKKIMQEFPDARIIMISAIGQKDKVLEAIECGAKNYIVKPINNTNVIKVLDKVKSLKPRNITTQNQEKIQKEINKSRMIKTEIKSDLLPFYITNNNGYFNFKIYTTFDCDDISVFRDHIKEFLNTNIVAAILDLADVSGMECSIVAKIIGTIKMIYDTKIPFVTATRNLPHIEGTLKVICEDERIGGFIRQNWAKF